GDGFGFGVDGGISNFGILRPERYKAPAHDGQLPLAGFTAEPDDRLKTLRGDVPGRRKEGGVEVMRVAGLERLLEELLVFLPAVASAHGYLSVLQRRPISPEGFACGEGRQVQSQVE